MREILTLLIYAMQVVLPFVMTMIVFYIFKSLFSPQNSDDTGVMLLNKTTGEKIEIMHFENVIGRNKSSDVFINDPTVSREHAVLYYRDENWMISDTNSKCGTRVNDYEIENDEELEFNDLIEVGQTELVLRPSLKTNAMKNKNLQAKVSSSGLLILITIFQILAGLTAIFYNPQSLKSVTIGLLGINLFSWLQLIFSKHVFKLKGFEVESLGILLTNIGILTLTLNFKLTIIQLIAFGLGLLGFNIIQMLLKNVELALRIRPFVAIASIIFLVVNLMLGEQINGAKNWIEIHDVSVQPSELIKPAFVIFGASTLERIQKTKNLTGFIIFSFACIGTLCIIGDFGSACVFFSAFIIISFMRSGSLRTLILFCSAAALGILMLVKFKPYITNRFSAWRDCWNHMNDIGYQQTRVLSYSASGGLFGVGLNKGYLRNIFAATSDLIFGVLAEEWGLILALTVFFVFLLLTLHTVKSSTKCKSVFYAISACSATGMLLFQAAINIFGCTDILPLTGVTLPFVSSGGSSIIASWCLLSIIKFAS